MKRIVRLTIGTSKRGYDPIGTSTYLWRTESSAEEVAKAFKQGQKSLKVNLVKPFEGYEDYYLPYNDAKKLVRAGCPYITDDKGELEQGEDVYMWDELYALLFEWVTQYKTGVKLEQVEELEEIPLEVGFGLFTR